MKIYMHHRAAGGIYKTKSSRRFVKFVRFVRNVVRAL